MLEVLEDGLFRGILVYLLFAGQISMACFIRCSFITYHREGMDLIKCIVLLQLTLKQNPMVGYPHSLTQMVLNKIK